MPITPPETICSKKAHLDITLTQIRADDADSLDSFRYKQATPRLSVVTTITKLTSKRYNVYRKQVGKPIRKSTCRSHEDAIKKQEEFRVLDEDKEDGLDNQPASLSTKRVGNYVPGPGRGIKSRVTAANCSLSVHKDKVFLQDIGAFINEMARQLSTGERHQGSSKNVPNEMISIQCEVLSKVLEAAKNNQAATMGDLLSKAGIFVFFLCVQIRCQNTLRRSLERENSFFVFCVLLVPYFRLILFVAFFLCDLRPISTPLYPCLSHAYLPNCNIQDCYTTI